MHQTNWNNQTNESTVKKLILKFFAGDNKTENKLEFHEKYCEFEVFVNTYTLNIWEYHQIFWNTLKLWNILEYFGTLRNSLEYFGTLWNA